MSDDSAKNMLHSELTVGYRVFRQTSLGLTAGYGSRSGNELYTLGAVITPGQFSAKKLFIESSIGGGIQKISGTDIRGVFIMDLKSGYHFTPSFGAGVGCRSYLTSKPYSSFVSHLFVAFRF